MNDRLIYLLWLSSVPSIGPKTQRSLLVTFGDPENIYAASLSELAGAVGIGETRAEAIVGARRLDRAERILEDCHRQGIEVAVLSSNRYPVQMRECDDMPVLLYLKGDHREELGGVGVVGARRCTQEDKQFAAELSRGYALSGTTVISGMAKGIDSYAHTACINAGGRTIAVLGCGLDVCYPSEHDLLMERIGEIGVLVSEYPPGTPPYRYHFPRRNRIIACLSEELHVIGAQRNSGAHITARYARKYGREVIYHDGE